MHDPNCWNCGKPSQESPFCKYCNTLQPPTPDYYKFLGLERKLNLDGAELQKRFYELSRKVHPDRYHSGASAKERLYSLEASAILNDAYRVLKDPVSRAEYILKDEGFDIGEQKSKNAPPELLEEVFELNMALEELRRGDASARAQIEEAYRQFLAMRDRIDVEIQQLFEEYDRTEDRSVLSMLRAVLNRRRYIRNLLDEVEKELAV